MLSGVIESIVSVLKQGGVNAVAKFPTAYLDRSKAICCVSMRTAKISASGCGNYIGLCMENGEIKEMLGSKAELNIGLDIYSPSPNCEKLKEQICTCIDAVPSLNFRCFEAGEVCFDEDCEMYRCECTVNAVACLVRQINSPDRSFALEED